jgi:hypothetical protein
MRSQANADRAAAVAALLEHEGIECEGVSVAGANGDVAVVRCRHVDSDRLAAVSRRIKALGFHWVTLDLGPSAS